MKIFALICYLILLLLMITVESRSLHDMLIDTDEDTVTMLIHCEVSFDNSSMIRSVHHFNKLDSEGMSHIVNL